MPPPYLEGSVASLPPSYLERGSVASFPPPKQDVAEATAESVPLVQADGFVPLVPAMYVEEVTPMAAPTASAVAALPPTTTAEAPQQFATSSLAEASLPTMTTTTEQPLQSANSPPAAPIAGSPQQQSGTSQDSSAPAHGESEVLDVQGSKEASKQQ